MTSGWMELSRVRAGHRSALEAFFVEIAADPAREFFRPHGFDAQQARAICDYAGRDLYAALLRQGRVLGYGMLRGWDEGFDTPSLGIFLHREARGTGAGGLFMHYLHVNAAAQGATSIRLTVDEANTRAIRFYTGHGYGFSQHSPGRLLGTRKL